MVGSIVLFLLFVSEKWLDLAASLISGILGSCGGVLSAVGVVPASICSTILVVVIIVVVVINVVVDLVAGDDDDVVVAGDVSSALETSSASNFCGVPGACSLR